MVAYPIEFRTLAKTASVGFGFLQKLSCSSVVTFSTYGEARAAGKKLFDKASNTQKFWPPSLHVPKVVPPSPHDIAICCDGIALYLPPDFKNSLHAMAVVPPKAQHEPQEPWFWGAVMIGGVVTFVGSGSARTS